MYNNIEIKELIDALGLSILAFEKKIGVGQSTIQAAIRRQSGLKEDTIQKIIKTFPTVSRHWLMTGEGSMFVNAAKNPVETPAENANNSVTSSDYSPLNEKDMTIHTLAAANRDLAETNRKVVSEMLELSKELRVLLHEMKQDARPKSKAS